MKIFADLIDGARDEAPELLALSEHVRKAIGEGRSRLIQEPGSISTQLCVSFCFVAFHLRFTCVSFVSVCIIMFSCFLFYFVVFNCI